MHVFFSGAEKRHAAKLRWPAAEHLLRMDGDEVLPAGAAAKVEFAQAVNQAHRALRRGDRSREPKAELEALGQRAEALAPRTG